MNPASLRPFPIPVVPFGPGSQGDEAPDYLPLPQGMETFSAPRLPDNASPASIAAAARLLGQLVDDLGQSGFTADVGCDLLPVPAAEREVITQSLGYGEVSAFTTAPRHWRVQETAFAGLWRVLQLDEAGQIVIDRLESGGIPPVLAATMQATASADLAAPDYPVGIMNAPALVEEIRQQAATWKAGDAAHVINLTLLPVSDADLDTLYAWLGHREVSILSRGYGNCRITSTRLKNVWWVQYFNSMDALILNSIEIVDMPEVALAAPEDFADSLERLREYLISLDDPL